MDIDYIGQNINGWTVKKSYSKMCKDKNRTFLEVECDNCHIIKEIRADKRNQLTICRCSKPKTILIKKDNSEKNIEKEWGKIKFCDIYTKEELRDILKQNEDYKIYRINNRLPYSSENIFIGTFKEFTARNKELKVKREYKIKQELMDMKRKKEAFEIKCPFCGKTSAYINACPYCHMSYTIEENNDSIHDPINKQMIEYENESYTARKNYFLVKQGELEFFYPLKEVVAKYIYQEENISRIGLINVKEIDYCNQGVIGDFQGIDSEQKNFLIDNVFQFNKFAPIIFINYEPIEREKVYTINKNDIIHYAVLIRKNQNLILDIYKGSEEIISIDNVTLLWGQGTERVYFQKNDQKNYCISLTDLNIEKTELSPKVEYLPGKMVLEYYKDKKSIQFFFNRTIFKNSIVLYYILNSRYSLIPIENEFEEDNVENYKADIPIDDYNIQNLISVIISRKSDALTHFGYSYNIYGYPLFRILRDLIKRNKYVVLEFLEPKYKDLIEYIIDIKDFSTTNTLEYIKIIDKLKDKYQCDDIELIKIMLKKYGIEQVFNLDYYYFRYRLDNVAKSFYSEIIDNIYQSLPENKVLWKSEYELYKLVKNSYPDAIYQYYDPKFKGLVIDIYIPELKVAIEYQGLQHYEVVERFIDNSLSERKENDKLKKQLCIDNGIKLIEWRYDELISQLNLEKKLKK